MFCIAPCIIGPARLDIPLALPAIPSVAPPNISPKLPSPQSPPIKFSLDSNAELTDHRAHWIAGLLPLTFSCAHARQRSRTLPGSHAWPHGWHHAAASGAHAWRDKELRRACLA